MNEVRIAHHLNCIKMCGSDRAIEKRIESIFAEGNSNGWKESAQCPKCMKQIPLMKQSIDYCESCANSGENKNG